MRFLLYCSLSDSECNDLPILESGADRYTSKLLFLFFSYFCSFFFGFSFSVDFRPTQTDGNQPIAERFKREYLIRYFSNETLSNYYTLK